MAKFSIKELCPHLEGDKLDESNGEFNACFPPFAVQNIFRHIPKSLVANTLFTTKTIIRSYNLNSLLQIEIINISAGDF